MKEKNCHRSNRKGYLVQRYLRCHQDSPMNIWIFPQQLIEKDPNYNDTRGSSILTVVILQDVQVCDIQNTIRCI